MPLQQHAAVPGLRVGLVEVAGRLAKSWLIITYNDLMEFFVSLSKS